MKIKNRIEDIKVLQAHVLQDYLQMTFEINFTNDSWKPIFYEKVKSGKDRNSKNSSNYIAVWEKLQLKGIENYSVLDMDASIIITILKHEEGNPFNVCRFDNMFDTLQNIHFNRNYGSHPSGNEKDWGTFVWAKDTLDNLSRFISSVVNTEKSTLPIEAREQYARKYRAEIVDLHLNIESDYKETVEAELIEQSIDKNIKKIKNSVNPGSTYVEYCQYYLNLKNNDGGRDYPLYYRFTKKAADEGILQACSWVGISYFQGLLTDKDYKKAAEYFEKGFVFLTPDEKLMLASIYKNNLSESSHNEEEIAVLIKSCEKPEWEIDTYTSKYGYEFYTKKRKVLSK